MPGHPLCSRVSSAPTRLCTLSLPGSCCSVPSSVLNDSCWLTGFLFLRLKRKGGSGRNSCWHLSPRPSFSTFYWLFLRTIAYLTTNYVYFFPWEHKPVLILCSFLIPNNLLHNQNSELCLFLYLIFGFFSAIKIEISPLEKLWMGSNAAVSNGWLTFRHISQSIWWFLCSFNNEFLILTTLLRAARHKQNSFATILIC